MQQHSYRDMRMTWRKQGQACLGSFYPFSSARINTCLSLSCIHACTHPASSLWERDASHSITRCPGKIKAEMRGGPAMRIYCVTSKGCHACVCFVGGPAVVCQREPGEKEGEAVCWARDFTIPLGDCFSWCVSCVCTAPRPLSLHLCCPTIWQMPPVLPPSFSLW